MSKNKTSGQGGNSPDHISGESSKIGDIATGARTLTGDDYSGGYPGIANDDMHNNQGRGGKKLRGKE